MTEILPEKLPLIQNPSLIPPPVMAKRQLFVTAKTNNQPN